MLYFGLMNQKPAPVSERLPLVILTTPRLILRTAVEEDISALQSLIFGDSDVMRFAFSGAPMAGDAAEDFIRRFFTFGDSLTGFAVLTEKPADEIIGFAGLASCGALGADDFEIGFVLARRAWGRGIATDIRDGNDPAQVRRFSEAILKLRAEPNLLSELTSLAADSICPVLVKNECMPQQQQTRSLFFFTGPERLLADAEKKLGMPKMLRIYPSDFWIDDSREPHQSVVIPPKRLQKVRRANTTVH